MEDVVKDLRDMLLPNKPNFRLNSELVGAIANHVGPPGFYSHEFVFDTICDAIDRAYCIGKAVGRGELQPDVVERSETDLQTQAE